MLIKLKVKIPYKSDNPKSDSRISILSPILGPKGIKVIDFLLLVNKYFKNIEYEYNYNIIVTIDAKQLTNGRVASYKLFFGTPLVSEIVKKNLNLKKLSSKPGKTPAILIDNALFEKIVELKKPKDIEVDIFKRTILGTLKSINVKIK